MLERGHAEPSMAPGTHPYVAGFSPSSPPSLYSSSPLCRQLLCGGQPRELECAHRPNGTRRLSLGLAAPLALEGGHLSVACLLADMESMGCSMQLQAVLLLPVLGGSPKTTSYSALHLHPSPPTLEED